MELRVNKVVGDSIINTIRQISMCRIPDTRPIAFKVGEVSDIVNIADTAEEDMTEFISNVSTSYYASSEELSIFKCTVKDILKASDIPAYSNVSLLITGVSELLHVLAPMSVTIYFRRGIGKYNSKENTVFLKRKKIDTDRLVVINSRHCPISSFSYKKSSVNDYIEKFDISVQTNGSISEEEVLEQAIHIFKEDLNNILFGISET